MSRSTWARMRGSKSVKNYLIAGEGRSEGKRRELDERSLLKQSVRRNVNGHARIKGRMKLSLVSTRWAFQHHSRDRVLISRSISAECCFIFTFYSRFKRYWIVSYESSANEENYDAGFIVIGILSFHERF